MMRENDFHVLLTAASFEATRFARNHVTNVLPFDFRYLVHLNQSCDEDPDSGIMLYPEDDGKVLDVDTERAVVELLCRDGRCPEWIDVSVHAVSPGGFTQIRLLCCGRYTSERKRLLYDERGIGPFGIKSPDFPKRWPEGEKFALKEI